MPTKPTPQKTLKQEKLWLIDAKQGEVTYDVSNDVNAGWWHKIPHGVDTTNTKAKMRKK